MYLHQVGFDNYRLQHFRGGTVNLINGHGLRNAFLSILAFCANRETNRDSFVGFNINMTLSKNTIKWIPTSRQFNQ